MTTMVAMTTMSNYACPCRVQKPDDNDDGDDNNDDNDNSGDDDNDDDDDVQLCMPKQRVQQSGLKVNSSFTVR